MLKYISKAELDLVFSGTKSAIAKLNIGFWEDIKVSDPITFTDGVREAIYTVKRKTYFQTFGEAWFSYKTMNGRHPVFPELDDSSITNMNDVDNHFKTPLGIPKNGIVVVEL
jgi:hypothetical protein